MTHQSRRRSSLRGHHRALSGRMAGVLSPAGARRGLYAARRYGDFCHRVAGHEMASYASQRARMFHHRDKAWIAILAHTATEIAAAELAGRHLTQRSTAAK